MSGERPSGSDPSPTASPMAPGAGADGTVSIVGGDVKLSASLARPAPSAAGGAGRHGIVLCHGFPVEPTDSRQVERGYRGLLDRLAARGGWTVLTFSFRGTAQSSGNFSLGGWLSDLKAAINTLVEMPAVDGVWVCGFA